MSRPNLDQTTLALCIASKYKVKTTEIIYLFYEKECKNIEISVKTNFLAVWIEICFEQNCLKF